MSSLAGGNGDPISVVILVGCLDLAMYEFDSVWRPKVCLLELLVTLSDLGVNCSYS